MVWCCHFPQSFHNLDIAQLQVLAMQIDATLGWWWWLCCILPLAPDLETGVRCPLQHQTAVSFSMRAHRTCCARFVALYVRSSGTLKMMRYVLFLTRRGRRDGVTWLSGLTVSSCAWKTAGSPGCCRGNPRAQRRRCTKRRQSTVWYHGPMHLCSHGV